MALAPSRTKSQSQTINSPATLMVKLLSHHASNRQLKKLNGLLHLVQTIKQLEEKPDWIVAFYNLLFGCNVLQNVCIVMN